MRGRFAAARISPPLRGEGENPAGAAARGCVGTAFAPSADMIADQCPARGPIFQFLDVDHRRLDQLLERAAADGTRIDAGAYAEFRRGLLRHIAMEEKILLPAMQRWRGGEPLPLAARLRLDHGAIAALLVPTPTPRIVATLRHILRLHNALEDGPGGLYETADTLAGAEAEALVTWLRATAQVPVSPFNDAPTVMPALERALARAGYHL